MLELEDQLDYEPDFIESDCEENRVTYGSNFIEESSIAGSNKGKEQHPKEGNEDQDDIVQLPEPSGQEDQESTNHSARQSLNYETDLEKTPSVSLSFRDKINYMSQHIDVEEGSFRSKYGRYAPTNDTVYLDSSDDDQELEDYQDSLAEEDIDNGENPKQPQLNSIVANLEDSYGDPEPEEEPDDSQLHDNCYASSGSQVYDNIIPSQEMWTESSRSFTSPALRAENIGVEQNLDLPQHNTVVPVPEKKRASLNFSIQVTGEKRMYLIPKIKKKPKPWVSTVEGYLDHSDVVKVCSKDPVIGFLPHEIKKPRIQDRLGGVSDNSSHTSESDSPFAMFKVPLKRPPTRLKGSGKNISVSVNFQSQQRKVGDMDPQPIPQLLNTSSNHDDKDDIISLMASSCHLSTAEELDERSLHIKDELFSFPGSSHGTEQAKLERTAQWVSEAIEPTRTAVPDIYKGLCYKYFFYNRCNGLCSRSHFLSHPQSNIKQLPSLSIEALKEAYEFAKEYPCLYGHIYKLFAEAFGVKDLKHELINMVNLIFEETSLKINQEEGLATVLEALQFTNLKTFEDTVQYLLVQIGLKRYPTLGNVLLEIICKKPDLVHHWPLVKLIIVGEKMNCKLGSKFLIHLMNSPVNVNVCVDVYHHILTYKFIDLPKISNAIKDQFLKICSQENVTRETKIAANIDRNLRQERFNFERTVEDNSKFLMLPDFSVPPPPVGRAPAPPSFNYIPTQATHQPDFASLSRQSTQKPNFFNLPPRAFNAPPPIRNAEDRRSRSDGSDISIHDVDFRRMPPQIRRNESSEEGPSTNGSRFSGSDSFPDPSRPALHNSKKRPAPTALMYNREGLHYDPANDYAPLPKKTTVEPLSEFDRLKGSNDVFHSMSLNTEAGAKPTFQRSNHNVQEVGPLIRRTNHNELTFARPTYNEPEVGPLIHRTERNKQGAGLTFLRPTHNEQELPPSSIHRTRHNEQVANPVFHRPNHIEQDVGPSVHRTEHNEQMANPVFHRLNHIEQEVGPSIHRKRHNEQGAEPVFEPPNHIKQKVGPSVHRTSRNEQGGLPVFEPPNRSIEQGVGLSVYRKRRKEQGAEPLFQPPIRIEQGVEPTVHRTRRNEHGPLVHRTTCTQDVTNRWGSFEQEEGLGFNRSSRDVQGARLVENVRMQSRREDLSVKSNEAAVSSSSDVMLRDEKPPEHPRIGTLYFDPNYEFNVSLHNFYLQAIDNVDIDEDDVHRLNDCVKKSDGKTFLGLVEKYKGPKTVQNFISMTLAHLKGMNQMVARTYQRLLDSIEQENKWFYGNMVLRVILEVITMNLLFHLFHRNMVEPANNFLKKFSDWDSLVTSRLFINNGAKAVSIIGRYLFLAKILNFSKPELACEILLCPALHLLERYEKWPYHPSCPIPEIFNADLQVRNEVLTQFLKTGYLRNTVAVIQLYKTAFRKKIWNFDVKPFIRPMIVDLINKSKIVSLKQISKEISLFCEFLNNDTLRALLIIMCGHVSGKRLFLLYDKCVDREIYQRLARDGQLEYTVEIKTNMQLCEIELIIKYYFDKLAEIKKVPQGSEPLRFEIKLPGQSGPKILPILNVNRSLVETNDNVRMLLKKISSVESRSLLPSEVEVPKDEIVNYLEKQWT